MGSLFFEGFGLMNPLIGSSVVAKAPRVPARKCRLFMFYDYPFGAYLTQDMEKESPGADLYPLKG